MSSPRASPRHLEALLRRADALTDDAAREVARDIAAGILDFHRAALRRFVELVRRDDEAGEACLRRAAQDEMVGSLLQLYDLGPQATASRGTPDARLLPVEHLTRRRGHERCGLCAAPLDERHDHLFDVAPRALVCACQACSLLFSGNANPRYRRIVPTLELLETFDLSPPIWAALAVPVGLAFFAKVATTGEVLASYPGPAGAVTAEVDAAAWGAVVAANPVLQGFAADVEALLVDRWTGAPRHYRASIDVCYRLTGLVRSVWRGINGGDRVPTVVAELLRSAGEVAR